MDELDNEEEPFEGRPCGDFFWLKWEVRYSKSLQQLRSLARKPADAGRGEDSRNRMPDEVLEGLA